MEKDITHYKEKLEAEQKRLEDEMKPIARRNPSNKEDWVARPETMDIQEADRNEAADRVESYSENVAILHDLEVRYNYVKEALERIENGTYGTCEVCKKEIETERLEANPAATTCIEHRDQERAAI